MLPAKAKPEAGRLSGAKASLFIDFAVRMESFRICPDCFGQKALAPAPGSGRMLGRSREKTNG